MDESIQDGISDRGIHHGWVQVLDRQLAGLIAMVKRFWI